MLYKMAKKVAKKKRDKSQISLSLRAKLLKADKKKWLDLGSTSFDPGFDCLSLGPLAAEKKQYSDRYINLNILTASSKEMEMLPKYDFIRAQHVLEHFSMVDGQTVLRRCADLLLEGGTILFTTPDLEIFTKAYLQGFKHSNGYPRFAPHLAGDDVPASFKFSMFTHQRFNSGEDPTGQNHKWCYDYEGLEYQFLKTGRFTDVRRLDVNDDLAEIPFTHNRPEQEVCITARKR